MNSQCAEYCQCAPWSEGFYIQCFDQGEEDNDCKGGIDVSAADHNMKVYLENQEDVISNLPITLPANGNASTYSNCKVNEKIFDAALEFAKTDNAVTCNKSEGFQGSDWSDSNNVTDSNCSLVNVSGCPDPVIDSAAVVMNGVLASSNCISACYVTKSSNEPFSVAAVLGVVGGVLGAIGVSALAVFGVKQRRLRKPTSYGQTLPSRYGSTMNRL